jgi:DNA-binding transcriptional regulator YdaS (Cro superfamily)
MSANPEELNPVERVIKAVGGLGALAKRLDISRQAVDKWRRAGVPAERVLFLESISGVSRSELRPDLYPAESSRLKAKRTYAG